MRNEYKCTAEVNMCADHVETIVVKTNLKNKAERIAHDLLLEKYFHVKIINIEQVE